MEWISSESISIAGSAQLDRSRYRITAARRRERERKRERENESARERKRERERARESERKSSDLAVDFHRYKHEEDYGICWSPSPDVGGSILQRAIRMLYIETRRGDHGRSFTAADGRGSDVKRRRR